MIQVTPDLVLALLKKYAVDEGVSRSVVEEIRRIGRINAEQVQIARDRYAEANRHAAAVADLDRRHDEMVASCRHPMTTCLPDPTGGGCLSRTCDLCGGEV